MVTNIDTLTDKIYREGIEKAQNEANELMENARKKSEEILKEARLHRDEIIDDARKQANEIQQNAMSDLQLSGKKAMNALKQEIKKMLHLKIVQQPVGALFSDVGFLKELILEVTKDYAQSATIHIPEKLKDSFQAALSASVKKELQGLAVDFNKRLEGGFQISKEDQDYIITFTDKDFIEFFKPYLNDKTEEILFKS